MSTATATNVLEPNLLTPAQIEEELEVTDRDLQIESTSEAALFRRALLLFALGKYKEADQTLRRLEHLNPTYPDLTDLRADIDAGLAGREVTAHVAAKRNKAHHPHKKYRLWKV